MRVMVVGGTSGIGLAVALHYLRQGAEVAVCGRDPDRLDAALAVRYPQLAVLRLDVADAGAVEAAVAGFGRDGLDLLLVSAGRYAGTGELAADAQLGLRMQAVNVNGLIHCFDAAARIMVAQGRGQLAAIASIAGLLPDYPGGSLYSSNKRAVIALCGLYRHTLARHGIAVTTVVPGYVDTAKLRELSGGDARHKPFLQSEAQAVAHIVDAIAQRRTMTIFPWQLHWLVRLFTMMPNWVRRWRQPR